MYGFSDMSSRSAAALLCLAFVVPFSCRKVDGPGRLESVKLGDEKSAGTRFEKIPPETSGVDFVHVWKPPDERRQALDNAFAGGGVCVGDYDSDGLPDIFLTRPQGGHRLYRNLGGFRFEDVTESAGIADDRAWGSGATFADVDNDGDLDIYACAYDSPNRLYINQGDSRFKEQAAEFGLDFRGASILMAFADYDLDGDLDGYLLTNRIARSIDKGQEMVKVEFDNGRPVVNKTDREHKGVVRKPDGQLKMINAGQYDRLYRNDGGTFRNVSEEAGVSGNYYIGLSATWWDYNDDGHPDLYVANDFETPDQLFRNNRDGTFTDVIRSAIPHTPWFSMGADMADLDNDGRFDLMASDMSGTTHFKQKVSMGDMANSGWFLTYPEPRQYMRNAVYLNTGTDRFMEVAYLTGLSDTDWTWAVKFADLDNDGWVDLYVSNGMTRNWFDGDMLRKSYAAPDVIFQRWLEEPKRAESNLAFKNHGDLLFKKVSKAWGLDHVGVSFAAALGDLDRDGDLDLVVNHFEEQASVYRNDIAGGDRVLIRLRGTKSNTYGVGATVRVKTPSGEQSRYVTLSRGFMSADEPMVHFGLGEHDVISSLTVEWPGGAEQSFDNLKAGRWYTITEPGTITATRKPAVSPPRLFQPLAGKFDIRHRERDYDDYERQPLLPYKLSQLGPGMAWGDVDGDGDEDLYLSAAAGQAGILVLKGSDGSLRPARILSKGFAQDKSCEDMAPLFLDTDGDGDTDLYVVSGGVECQPGDAVLRDRLYLNDGKGTFSKAPEGALPDLRDSGSVVTAADFDRDGDLDLFVGGRVVPGKYPLTPTSRLLQNDAGKFTEVTEELAPGLGETGLVTSAVWSDADDDGWPDLLVTHEWGPVKLWRNEKGRLVDRTGAAALAERLGWWNGIAARDLDHDGDIDYVVTNFGLNTKYRVYPDKPLLLYYGDFEEKGVMRLVEAHYEDDHLFPVRGRSCSSAAMPTLGEKFPSFKSFASASLEDIYTPRCLSESHRFEANTLESGVLWNDGTGKFTFRPLPRLAQASPAFGAIIADVDGDTHADIYIVQNFFGPQPETGRMDGGVSLLLRGDSTGNFTPVSPDASGLIVPGDAKGVTVIDLQNDGWPDFVVGINDGKVVAFENRGSASHRVLQVRLDGRKGNPTAVGARVTVQLDDGSTQTAEVHAGGGYLSQSPSTLRFGLGPLGARDVTVRWPDGETTTTPAGKLLSLTLKQR